MPTQRAALLAGSFAATGQSEAREIRGKFNMEIRGGTGAVQLEKSYDQGVTFTVVSKDVDGNPASYDPNVNPVNLMVEEAEPDVLYRFNCTAFTAGPINYRLSR